MIDLRKAAEMALNAFETIMFEKNAESCQIIAKNARYSLREALAQTEQEPVAWRNAAIRFGEDLYSVGPDGYYDMTAKQWLDWALSVVNTAPPKPEQEPVAWMDKEDCGDMTFTLIKPTYDNDLIPLYTAPPKPEPKSMSTNDHLCAMLRQVHDVLACTALPMKRPWQGLTEEDRNKMIGRIQHDQYTRQRDLIGKTQIITEMYLKEKNNAV